MIGRPLRSNGVASIGKARAFLIENEVWEGIPLHLSGIVLRQTMNTVSRNHR